MRRLGNAILVCACALIVTTPVFADGPELEPTRSELNWLECVEALVGISITDGLDVPAGNLPPIAEAELLASPVYPGQPVVFSGASSYDNDGAVVNYRWHFPDTDSTVEGPEHDMVLHTFYEIGDAQPVYLSVQDDAGAWSVEDVVYVDVLDPSGEPLSAEFKVYQLVYVDPATGEETWEEVVLPNDDAPVELGLRLKFDASFSTGAIGLYMWDFGDGTYGSNAVEMRQCNEDLTVTLTVYNTDYTEMAQYGPVALAVQSSLDLIGQSGTTGTFACTRTAHAGEYLWMSTSCGKIVGVAASDPGFPDTLVRTYVESVPGICDLAASEQDDGTVVLLAARGPLGLEAWEVVPGSPELNPELLQQLTFPDLSVGGVTLLSVAGETHVCVSAGAYGHDYIVSEYELATLLAQPNPAPIRELSPGFAVTEIGAFEDQLMCGGVGVVSVFAMYPPDDPTPAAEVIDIPTGSWAVSSLALGNDFWVIGFRGGVAIMDAESHDSWMVHDTDCRSFALCGSRLFGNTLYPHKIRKYCINAVDDVYLMQSVTVGGSAGKPAIVFCGVSPILMLPRESCGVSSFAIEAAE